MGTAIQWRRVQEAQDRYSRALSDLENNLEAEWKVERHQTRKFAWRIFRCNQGPDRSQGWKIHVSAAVTEADDLCQRVLPILVRLRATFKIPDDLDGLLAINNGDMGETQIGKIVTIYPNDDCHATLLIDELDSAWRESSGPQIPTDRPIYEGARISLRYGGFTGSRVLIDSQGFYKAAIEREDGSFVIDERSPVGLQPAWAPPPPVPCIVPTFDPLRSQVVGGIEYLPLVLLHNSPKGCVQLAMNLESGATAVLKRSRAGVGSDYFGSDAGKKLINEHDVLQALTGTSLAPTPFGLSISEEIVLALEDKEGAFLNELSRAQQIRSIPLLARAISELHDHGFAHSDIKLSNAVLCGDRVKLTDFELAGPIGDVRVFFGGTTNYFPAGEWSSSWISSSRDIFALGVCTAHAILGVDPAGLVADTGRLIGCLSLIGEHRGASVVRALCSPSSDKRPSASESLRIIEKNLQGLPLPRSFGKRDLKCVERTRRWCVRASMAGANATREYVESSESRNCHWWRNQHINSAFSCEGVNIGAAGIVLGLMSIGTALFRPDLESDIVGGAQWLSDRPSVGTCAGLFTGDAGVALALAVAGRRFQREDWIRSAAQRLKVALSSCEGTDLFNGKAGVLLTACTMSKILGEEWPIDAAEKTANSLRASSKGSGGAIHWDSEPDAEGGHTGAAHGSSGIALALAIWSKHVNCVASEALALETFQSIFQHARGPNDDDLMSNLHRADKKPMPAGNWCHGIGGYLWCLLAAFGNDPRISNVIDWAVNLLTAVTPVQNPTYCHGLSGQLELWRILQAVPRHRTLAEARALQLASMLRVFHLKTEAGFVWASEQPQTITPDLWIGFLGPASALALYASGSTEALLSSSWLLRCSGGLRAC